MPLSVPLKNSRARDSRGFSYAAHTATQAAAQLAAQSGAQAKNGTAMASTARPGSPAVPTPTPMPPMPPATGSMWGHHGASASSTAANQAPTSAVSFHNGPSGRLVEEKGRCREIGEHPCLRNPGPTCYDIPVQKDPCMVPNGWMKEPRFKNSPFAGEQQIDNPTKLLKLSTECHPLSRTYPYPEPSTCNSGHEAVAVQETTAAEKQPNYMRPSAQNDLEDLSDRRNPIRTVDLNQQHFKYKSKPTWGFGSSGLGFRFAAGTPFSKQPQIKPNTRLRGFRELREAMPERTEKECQDVLERAMTEAAEAASQVTAPAAELTDANKRKSHAAKESKRGMSKERPEVTAPPATDAEAATAVKIDTS